MSKRNSSRIGSAASGVSRRKLLQAGAGLAGSALLPMTFPARAFAADQPAIGTWPDGSKGDTVNVAAAVPRTGTYAVQGEDELKGWQLAVEHINSGDPLLKKIAPKVTKGLLGKKVNLLSADSAAKPNQAVQEIQTFINQNKIVLMTGSTSSAVAVALNKFAQREHVLYVTGISGSNDTTGKDCVRYGFRQNFYGETAANAIGPVLVKAYGKNKKAAFMTPDYTYGHTVTKSVNEYLTKNGGWTQVTDQVSPLGTQDFSQYITNIANSGADVIINVNWGRDAVLSVQQCKQFGVTPKMQMVIPYQIPFLAKEAGPELTENVYAATDYLVDAGRQVSAGEDVHRRVRARSSATSRSGARRTPTCRFAIWARMVTEAGSFYPPAVIKQYEKGETIHVAVGDVHYPPGRPPVRPPGDHRQGQGAEGDEEQGGLLGGPRSEAGRAADAEAGRIRLQAR